MPYMRAFKNGALKRERHLSFGFSLGFGVWVQLFVEHAWLNILVVLVLATLVLANVANNLVVEDLLSLIHI